MRSQLWTPAFLDAALWLDAADPSSVIVSGSTISQWSDKSGKGNHVTNSTGATQPAYLTDAFNDLPTVSFTAAGTHFLFNGGMSKFVSTNDYFIAAVFEMRQPTQLWDMICGFRSAPNASTSGAPVLQAMSNSLQIGVHNTDVADVRIKVDVTTRLVKRIATVGRSGGTAGNGGIVTVTATEPSQASYLTTGTQAWSSNSTSGFQIGGRQQGGTVNYGDKYISEIICCAFNPSSLLRQKIEGYLAHKWRLTASLPMDHPFKTFPPRL